MRLVGARSLRFRSNRVLLSILNHVWPRAGLVFRSKNCWPDESPFWNIRGFGAREHEDQLRDVVRGDSIDMVGLVETFKSSFSPYEFSAVVGTDKLPLWWYPYWY